MTTFWRRWTYLTAGLAALAMWTGAAYGVLDARSVRPDGGLYQTDLAKGATFSIVLVVSTDNARKIDVVDVICANDGILDTGQAFTLDTNVKVRNGKFRLETEQVVVKGRFTKATQAKGTIEVFRRARADVAGCGFSDGDSWVSRCTLGIRKVPMDDEDGGLVVSGSIVTGSNGTTIVQYSKGPLETVDPTGACAENAPTPRVTPEEQAFLDVLGSTRESFASDQDAIAAGHEACDELRSGSYNVDLTDPRSLDVFLAAVRTFCPEYSDLVQVYPSQE